MTGQHDIRYGHTAEGHSFRDPERMANAEVSACLQVYNLQI